MAGEGKCRSCGALVLWVKLLPNLKPHPLDAVPSPKGTIERRRGTLSDEQYGKVLPADERQGRALYVSHFATCPQAAQHRSAR